MLVLEKALSLFVTLMHIPKTIYHSNGHSRDPMKTMPNLGTNHYQERKYLSKMVYSIFLCIINNFINYSISFLMICHNEFSGQLTCVTPRTNQIIMFRARLRLVLLRVRGRTKQENKKCLAYFNYCLKVFLRQFLFSEKCCKSEKKQI